MKLYLKTLTGRITFEFPSEETVIELFGSLNPTDEQLKDYYITY